MTFAGRVWRYLPRGAMPLHLGFVLKAAGRWNRAGDYGALYTATTREGAIAEYRKAVTRIGPAAFGPRDLVSLDVVVEPVCDLTRPSARRYYGLTLRQARGDRPDDLAACRRVADAARRDGHVALLVPSSAAPKDTNLVIYPDGPASAYDLRDGPDRDPLPDSTSER